MIWVYQDVSLDYYHQQYDIPSISVYLEHVETHPLHSLNLSPINDRPTRNVSYWCRTRLHLRLFMLSFSGMFKVVECYAVRLFTKETCSRKKEPLSSLCLLGFAESGGIST